jgi:hypothetical protein
MSTNDRPEKIRPLDGEIAEEWVRKTAEPDVRGVGAYLRHDGGSWPWRVTVWAAEFIREDPLEQDLRDAIRVALEAVSGVTRVVEEDREVWAVAGKPTGQALISAAAEAIDRLQGRLRAAMRQH